METIHDEAARFGIERPELQYYTYQEGEVTVIAPTMESEVLWSQYLREISMAKLALKSVDSQK